MIPLKEVINCLDEEAVLKNRETRKKNGHRKSTPANLNSHPNSVVKSPKKNRLKQQNAYRFLPLDILTATTTKKYAGKIHERNIMHLQWNMSNELRAAFGQYLLIFPYFCKNIHNLETDIALETNKSGISISFPKAEDKDFKRIDLYLKQFVKILQLSTKEIYDIKKIQRPDNLKTRKVLQNIIREKNFFSQRVSSAFDEAELLNSLESNFKETEFFAELRFLFEKIRLLSFTPIENSPLSTCNFSISMQYFKQVSCEPIEHPQP